VKRQGHGPGTEERWEKKARYTNAVMRRMGSVERSRMVGGIAPRERSAMLEKREKVECLLHCQILL
jgi:hypothetical protein